MFWSNPWTNPLGKMPIWWVFETDVFVVQKRLFAISNVENRFSTISFRDLWHGNTGVYKRLLGVTRGYKRLPGVSRGYKGLDGVTRVKRGLQGVRGADKGLQRILETFSYLERSQRLFLGLFCKKIKVEEISNFWPKRWTKTFGKILIFRFSETVVFIVFKDFFFI